jgi:hypothetical protein
MSSRLRDDDDVDRSWERETLLAEDLANVALEAVADDGVSDSGAHGHTEP